MLKNTSIFILKNYQQHGWRWGGIFEPVKDEDDEIQFHPRWIASKYTIVEYDDGEGKNHLHLTHCHAYLQPVTIKKDN